MTMVNGDEDLTRRCERLFMMLTESVSTPEPYDPLVVAKELANVLTAKEDSTMALLPLADMAHLRLIMQNKLAVAAARDGKAAILAREGAMLGIAALANAQGACRTNTNIDDGSADDDETMVNERLFEAWLCSMLPRMLDLLSDKDASVKKAATVACAALVPVICPWNFVYSIVPSILVVLDNYSKWQTQAGSLTMLQKFANRALAGDDALRCQVDLALPLVVPIISDKIWDTKKDISDGARGALLSCVRCISNPDVHGCIDDLVNCIADPSLIPEVVEILAATTFVAEVRAPTLSVITPLLCRGLLEKKTAILRRVGLVIRNMIDLVREPDYLIRFLPELFPRLRNCIATAPDPELREVLGSAQATIERVGGDILKPFYDLSEEENHVDKSSHDALDRINVELKETADIFVDALCLSSDARSRLAVFIDFAAGTALGAAAGEEDSWSLPFVNSVLTSILAPIAVPDTSLDMKFICEVVALIVKRVVMTRRVRCGKSESGDETEVTLCNTVFSLAYGSLILLNQTRLRLVRGARYGLCGRNGAGKSTLLRAISNGQVDGFPPPEEVLTVFVEHDIEAASGGEGITSLSFITKSGPTLESAIKALSDIGMNPETQAMPVEALSGGWKMKVQIIRAMLMGADLLLLDEPTNHLDTASVKWLENWLLSQKGMTAIMVSHDPGFLDNVCTHILHYETKILKLSIHPGNLSAFVKIRPEASAYYDLSQTVMSMTFPRPGLLDGIKSGSKVICRMRDVCFTYPGSSTQALHNVSLACTLRSRVAIVGPNGAGKSTIIKILTGGMIPRSGVVWRHPTLRLSYVAQHAFFHVEQHMDKTPNEYMQWRFAGGEDKELMRAATRQLTPEEAAILETPITGRDGSSRRVEMLLGRRKSRKGYEYEVKWRGMKHKDNVWMDRSRLEDLGFGKLLQMCDDRESVNQSLDFRSCTSSTIEPHLELFGIEKEVGTHTRIQSLSGGQKVKVVLAAAFWNCPHLCILDEPTNYLDRDALGALAEAIKKFEGAIVIVSHDKEFCNAVCDEEWNVEGGVLTASGSGVTTDHDHISEGVTNIELSGTAGVKVKKLTRKQQREVERLRAIAKRSGRTLEQDKELGNAALTTGFVKGFGCTN